MVLDAPIIARSSSFDAGLLANRSAFPQPGDILRDFDGGTLHEVARTLPHQLVSGARRVNPMPRPRTIKWARSGTVELQSLVFSERLSLYNPRWPSLALSSLQSLLHYPSFLISVPPLQLR